MTLKELSFVLEYLIDGNATQAYIRSNYSNCTPESARRIASKLLTKVDIQAAIQRHRDNAIKNTELNLENVLGKLWTIASVNVRDFYDHKGNLIAIRKLPEDVSIAIAGIESEEIRRGAGKKKQQKGSILKKIKTYNVVDALKDLRKHFVPDTVNIGISPEMLKLTMDIINALPPKEAKRVWGIVESQVKALSEKAGPSNL